MNIDSRVIRYRHWRTHLMRSHYVHTPGRHALALVDAMSGEPVATCTVNLPDVRLATNEVFIRDSEENTGMVECLVRHGVISDPVEWVPCGRIQVARCRLLPQRTHVRTAKPSSPCAAHDQEASA